MTIEQAVIEHHREEGHEKCVVVLLDLNSLDRPFPIIICVRRQGWQSDVPTD